MKQSQLMGFLICHFRLGGWEQIGSVWVTSSCVHRITGVRVEHLIENNSGYKIILHCYKT